MRKVAIALLVLGCSGSAAAHVTPNVSLVKRGDFVKQTLPGASKYFEQFLDLPAARAAVQAATGWSPSAEDMKAYVGRDEQGHTVGRVVFLWLPSEHGPVGIGVAFDSEGRVRQAAVTDVASEPLPWVRPLLEGLGSLSGLTLEAAPDPAQISPAAKGKMTRYYAEVIAAGVWRARNVETALRKGASR